MYAPLIHLAKRPALSGEIFMGSENDEITQMFDSAKSGPEYMGKSAIRSFFTPVDIPLFTANTVTMFIYSGAEPACPVSGG